MKAALLCPAVQELIYLKPAGIRSQSLRSDEPGLAEIGKPKIDLLVIIIV
jgi:hypothetical protein